MNIIFCNIGWMKNYCGVNEKDVFKRGGIVIEDHSHGYEHCDFLDYDGRCYSLAQINDDIWNGDKEADGKLENVLVVCTGRDDFGKLRIAGWYRDASVYKEKQFRMLFTEEYDIVYNIESMSKNAFLLDEKDRTFVVDESIDGYDLIQDAIKYIESYTGAFINKVYDESMDYVINDESLSGDYEKLYEKGLTYYNRDEYEKALGYFNAALKIHEDADLLFDMGDCFLGLNDFRRALSAFHKVAAIEGDSLETSDALAVCYDYMGNREKTAEYLEKKIEFLGDSDDDVEEKLSSYCSIFNIYVSLNEKDKAEKIIEKILHTCSDDDTLEMVSNMRRMLKA